MSNIIRRILRADLCAGCGLCESIAADCLDVRLNENGFFRPVFKKDLSKEQDRILRETCPALTVQHSAGDKKMDPIWGPILKVCTGYSGDKSIRHRGSSGGVLTTLQLNLLRENKVEAVINVGASTNEPLLNQVYLCRRVDELVMNAGSRYAPSAPLKDIHRMIGNLERIAFVGKPCDVSALRLLAKVDPRLRGKRIFYLSFLCAGIPSQKATVALVDRLGFRPEEIAKFRYRGEGWPGCAKAETLDGRSASLPYTESWGKVLNQYLQTRCKVCPDGTGEFADISCGDAWHGDERGYPDFSERPGRSVILIRTKKGQSLLEEAVDTNELIIEQEGYSLHELNQIQPYQVNRRSMILSRTLAFALFKRIFVHFDLIPAIKAAKRVPLKSRIRDFLGTMKRLITARRP